MSTTHKLYRDDRFFDLTADPYEKQPGKAAGLTGADAKAAGRLKAVFDQ